MRALRSSSSFESLAWSTYASCSGVSSACGPLLGPPLEVPQYRQARRGLLDPATELRPVAQEQLVRQIDRLDRLGERLRRVVLLGAVRHAEIPAHHQPGLHQGGQCRVESGPSLLSLGSQRRHRRPPPPRRQLDHRPRRHPHQDPLGLDPVGIRQPVHAGVGVGGQHPRQPAIVDAGSQPPPLAVLPQLVEHQLQHRQRPGLGQGLGAQPLGEPGVELQPHAPRRLGDHPLELPRLEMAHEDRVRPRYELLERPPARLHPQRTAAIERLDA
jgi:hypothetical protein